MDRRDGLTDRRLLGYLLFAPILAHHRQEVYMHALQLVPGINPFPTLVKVTFTRIWHAPAIAPEAPGYGC
jgi:hypothetical protein